MIEYYYREHTGQRFRKQHAPSAQTKELRACRLNPETKWRLIQSHKTATIEGDKEKVMPARQHTFHASSVVCIRISFLVELSKIQHNRHQKWYQPGQILQYCF